MMESRDMRRGLRPAEGVCVLVGAETKKKITVTPKKALTLVCVSCYLPA